MPTKTVKNNELKNRSFNITLKTGRCVDRGRGWGTGLPSEESKKSFLLFGRGRHQHRYLVLVRDTYLKISTINIINNTMLINFLTFSVKLSLKFSSKIDASLKYGSKIPPWFPPNIFKMSELFYIHPFSTFFVVFPNTALFIQL